MADETPAPLSDDVVKAEDVAWPQDIWRQYVRELKMTLAARDAEIERLKSQVAIHETWRQDAEFRLASEHERHMREYADDSATLAAYRSALADVLAAADGSVGLYTPGEHLSVTRARALLAGIPAPGTTGATAGEDGEA